MTVDKQGLVMAGTGDGLYIYENQQWRNITVSETEFMYNDIQDIAIDINNTGWFATAKGLASYAKGVCSIHDTLGLTFFTSKLQCVAVDWNNIVWVGSFFDGTVAKCSNPVVLYDKTNTAALKDVVRINDIDTYTTNKIFFATEYNGIILIEFTYVYK
jgi:ligand-binding sensor domain-containing protein